MKVDDGARWAELSRRQCLASTFSRQVQAVFAACALCLRAKPSAVGLPGA
jgi:hypothetical protein